MTNAPAPSPSVNPSFLLKGEHGVTDIFLIHEKPVYEINDSGSHPATTTMSALSLRSKVRAHPIAIVEAVQAVEKTYLGPPKPNSLATKSALTCNG